MEAGRIEYASFGRRLQAFFIDAVIQLAVFYLWGIVALFVFQPTPAESMVFLHGTDSPDTGPVSPISESEMEDLRKKLGKDSGDYEVLRMQIGGGLILLVLYTIGFWAWRGQTPGKMALRIRVVGVDGHPIGVGRAIVRYAGYLASTLVFLGGYLMIGLTPRKQGLHDKIARTYVVRT